MGRRKCAWFLCVSLLALLLPLASCKSAGKTAVRVLVVAKYEAGNISGDALGEAQLFYEHYCADCEETTVPNAPQTAHFYLNEENGVGVLLTGSGKTAAGLSMMSLLSCDAYDFSDTTIVSVGCAGGNTGSITLGDVVVVTAACDYELGHGTDSSELGDPDTLYTWFHDDAYEDYSHALLNEELCDKAFELVKDCSMRTTETCKRILEANFPGEEWAARDPLVVKGTAITADNYWKGEQDHANANFIAQYYGCPDEYAITEMEEMAVVNAAACFGLQDRVISLRVAVNVDTFLNNESPETLWGQGTNANDIGLGENSETFDIFGPGMENLFDVGSILVDAVLAGEL